MPWEGSETLKKLLTPVADLREHPANPRKGNVEVIKDSLAVHGQFQPIVANKDGTILAGNHTYRAARQLGWDKIAVVRVDVDDAKARQILIVANRAGDVATYDEELLSDVLQQLQDDGLLGGGTGWSIDDVEDYLADIGVEEFAPIEEFQGGYAETEEEFEERAASKPPSTVEPLREVVLMYRQNEYNQFGRWVAFLEKIYGTRGSVATVYETMKRAAEAEGFVAELDESEIPEEADAA